MEEEPTKRGVFCVEGPIIVGAGPSGMAVAACLSTQQIPYLLLEKANCVASLWREKSYDRLKLHLPKKFCELPFMSFPSSFPQYPSRHQFLAYLNSYASFFSIAPLLGQKVTLAEWNPNTSVWNVETQERCYSSKWLVIATGENAEPVIPDIHGAESFRGMKIHTSDYKSGVGYKGKKVLVIGCGNSGMEVCLDLSTHGALPHLVVRNCVHVLPREVLGMSTFGIATSLLKRFPVRVVDMVLLLMARVSVGDTRRLGVRRPKLGPMEHKMVTGKTPVLDVGALHAIRAGKIKVMKGVRKIAGNRAEFVDGKEEQFDSIVFATGYKSNVTLWLREEEGELLNEKGKVGKVEEKWKGERGLYGVGFSRKGILGCSLDAVKVGADIGDQWRKRRR